MVKLTIGQVNNSLQALSIIGGQPMKGNAKLAYNISKILKGLRVEAETAREQEEKLFREFDAQEKDGRLFFESDQLSSDQQTEFGQRIKDLYSVEVEIWGSQITLAEIDAAGLALSPAQFEQLDWLIADPESEKPKELS